MKKFSDCIPDFISEAERPVLISLHDLQCNGFNLSSENKEIVKVNTTYTEFTFDFLRPILDEKDANKIFFHVLEKKKGVFDFTTYCLYQCEETEELCKRDINITFKNRTDLINFLKKYEDFYNGDRDELPDLYCDKCYKEYKEKNDPTNLYIEHYLNPERLWNPSTKNYEKLKALRYAQHDKEKVSSYIKNMPYQLFLQTPFWKGVAQYCKQQAKFRCQLCNGNQMLQTHHRTYKTHGSEQWNVEDLVVLCGNCHMKFHKEEES